MPTAPGETPNRWGFDNDHLGTLMPFGAPSTPSFPNRDGARQITNQVGPFEGHLEKEPQRGAPI